MERNIRFVSPFERALYLKTLEPLQNLPKEELAVMAQSVVERFYQKGETIIAAGEHVDRFHLIIQGRVDALGAEHEAEKLGPGCAVGILSLLSHRDDLQAVAATDVVTLQIDESDLFDLYEDHFRILHAQIQDIARRILRSRKQIPRGTYLAPAEGLNLPDRENLDLIQRLLIVRRAGTFRQTSMEGMIQIARLAEETKFAADTTLWKVGQPSGFSYMITHGSVMCKLPDGSFFRVGPGYPLGNLESQCNESRWYEAITETPLLCARTRADTLLDVLEDHFDMALDFLATMATNLIHLRQEKRQKSAP